MQQINFTQGGRTYFASIKFSQEGGDQYIEYGATVYHSTRSDSDIPSELIDGHFKTATERFTKYPVYIKFGDLPHTTRTRLGMKDYLSSKSFKKRFISIMCKNGVRVREDGVDSLRGKELIDAERRLKKDMNREVSNYQDDISNHNRDHKHDRLDHISNGQVGHSWNYGEVENSPAMDYHELVFWDNGRLFHVSYNRFGDGDTRYGACIFKPTCEEDWDRYNENDHFNTAYQRMSRFGVEVHVPQTHRYHTRENTSGRINPNDDEKVGILRKHIARYGVRVRRGKDGMILNRFVKKHLIGYEHAKKTKGMKRELDVLEWNRGAWNEVRTL